ncbi:MAG TPA: cytochrome c biogenesis protein CcdA [Dongiaceae bacterium]
MTPTTFDLGAYGFGLLAGILSLLSPCVLPLLPIVLGSAVAAHRFGAVALAAGLALSFVLVGLFVATIGFSLGLDGELFRRIGAGLLLIFGLLMLMPAWQTRLTAQFGRLGARIGGGHLQQQVQDYAPVGVAGQFLLGLLLGVIWSPCVGPTLGAAATLAAQRQNLGAVAAMMTVFGIGASLPLLAIGLTLGHFGPAAQTPSGTASGLWRRRGLFIGRLGKALLGLLLILLGLLILSGFDRPLEARLVDWSPAWLTALTTRF